MRPDRDPVQRYLDELRVRLRAPDAHWILAEAEDHLREGTAAGLAAGMTETEAQEAAISGFGSVQAVIRAHQTRRGRVATMLSGPAAASSTVAGLFLAAFGASSLAGIAGIAMGAHDVPLTGPIVQHVAAGTAGLLLLAGGHLIRRFQRRRDHVVAARSARLFPLVALTVFGGSATVLVLLNASGTVPVGRPSILACLVVAAGYAVRMRILRRTGKLA
jgi:hypothetical protein